MVVSRLVLVAQTGKSVPPMHGVWRLLEHECYTMIPTAIWLLFWKPAGILYRVPSH